MQDNHILPFLWMRGESPEVIREEIEKINEAGIKSVCLEARPHPEYAEEKWWRDMDIVIEEAKKYGMTIWILDDAHFPTGMANDGMKKYPEKCRRFLYTQFVDATGPLPSAQVDIDLLMTKQFTWMDIGKPESKPLFEETKLLSVTAYKIKQDDLLTGESIDLTTQVKDGYLTADIPEGTWRIFVSFSTTAIGEKPEYINYIENDSVQVLIDEVYEKHYERYKELFGNVIAGFFSDEPGFYNAPGYDENNKLGRHMALPWGKELDEMLRGNLGEDFYTKLPLLYANDFNNGQKEVRVAYMDAVSKLYSKNFSCKLGDWCSSHNVRYIGHIVEDSNAHMRLVAGVGHYFRAMKGQDMAGIDNIGYQIMPCNDVASRHTGFQDLKPDFYHYELGKLGASAAALDPKKQGRLMCENFGAYGWRLGVRDMKWLVDFFICQGVNYFVPHAFSMAEYPDVDCPPHFYARGNNPQFKYFCQLMKYTDRLCNLFSDGLNVPQVAVLYEAESDWAGNTMLGSAVGKELLTNQIDFEFIPADVFSDSKYYGCKTNDGNIIVNGREMAALIIPECEYISKVAAEFIANNKNLQVIFVNSYPRGIAEEENDELLNEVVSCVDVVALDKLSSYLKDKGIEDDLKLKTSGKNLRQYHYRKNGQDIYFLMNVSSNETFDSTIILPGGVDYGIYDAMSDVTYQADADGEELDIVIKPYESLVIVSNPKNAVADESLHKLNYDISLNTFDLRLREIGVNEEKIEKGFKLCPISNKYRDFAGTIIYETELDIDDIPKRVEFSAQYVFECMTVFVNGNEVASRIVPPYDVDITSALIKGNNHFEIHVATTALRNANTKPGIFGKERTIIEPTGMFGDVKIKFYE